MIFSLFGFIGLPVMLMFNIGDRLNPPPPPSNEIIPRGSLIYAESCAICHGTEGEGTPANVNAPPLDGTGDISRLTDVELQGFILNGGEGMPAFRKVLSPKDLSDVIEHIQSWQP